MEVRFSDGTKYQAESVERFEHDGKRYAVLINPVLPNDFYTDEAGKYGDERSKWYGLAYIDRAENVWFPSGERFMVHCRDGGCWDRPTMWGAYGTLAEALECVRLGPEWRRG